MNNARQAGAVLAAHFQFMQWLSPVLAQATLMPFGCTVTSSPERGEDRLGSAEDCR
jgi:hypothetical protein